MARIQFTENADDTGHSHDGVLSATYAGQTHRIQIYKGDTRPRGLKIAAIKECLRLRVLAGLQEGETPPDADGA